MTKPATIRSILAMLKGYEHGHTALAVAEKVGMSPSCVGKFFQKFAAEGFLRPGTAIHSLPVYLGPDLIGKPADAKETTVRTGTAKGTSHKGQAKG